jgi:hypothetical protein
MSFDGHDRPFPRWFPFFFAGLAIAGTAVYYALA